MLTIERPKFDSPSDDIIVWKYPSESLALGSRLVVNDGQEALFVVGGQACDLFGPGTHTLETANLPLIGRAVSLPFAGKTPFTAEVWFVNRTVKRDVRWGTQSPIPLIEPTFGYPVSVRAFGHWGFRVQDTRKFILRLVGSQLEATADLIHRYFSGEICQRFSVCLSHLMAEQKVSLFDVNTRLNDLAGFASSSIGPELELYGIELVSFNVERVSIPAEELAAMQEVRRRRMEIEQVSDLKVGQAYVTMRAFDVLEKSGEGGGATGALLAGGFGLGVGSGVGLPLGKKVAESINSAGSDETSSHADVQQRLELLKRMHNEGLISDSEFEAKKQDVLRSI